MKSYTDIKQSRKLAEFLPIESADMFIADVVTPKVQAHSYNFHVLTTWGCKTFAEIKERESKYVKFIPCWSLAALLDILPEIQGGKPVIALDDNYITYPHMSDLYTKVDNLVDACVAMIEKLHELKML